MADSSLEIVHYSESWEIVDDDTTSKCSSDNGDTMEVCGRSEFQDELEKISPEQQRILIIIEKFISEIFEYMKSNDNTCKTMSVRGKINVGYVCNKINDITNNKPRIQCGSHDSDQYIIYGRVKYTYAKYEINYPNDKRKTKENFDDKFIKDFESWEIVDEDDTKILNKYSSYIGDAIELVFEKNKKEYINILGEISAEYQKNI